MYHRHEFPGLIHFDTTVHSDWYMLAPEIHLNSYLYASSFDYLFSWVKFFFAPDLYWWNYMDMPDYEQFRHGFEQIHIQLGTEAAKSAGFNDVMTSFAREAEWLTPKRRGSGRPSVAEPGLPGRVRRVLREAGEAESD